MHGGSWRAFLVVEALLLSLSVSGCSAPHDPRADAIVALAGQPTAGEVLYRGACAHCHGDTGAKLANGLAWYGLSGSISIVIDGGWKMPAFPRYSDPEIADLFAYLGSFRK
jgi:mono/diheme cytochrome c family protein